MFMFMLNTLNVRTVRTEQWVLVNGGGGGGAHDTPTGRSVYVWGISTEKKHVAHDVTVCSMLQRSGQPLRYEMCKSKSGPSMEF